MPELKELVTLPQKKSSGVRKAGRVRLKVSRRRRWRSEWSARQAKAVL